MDPQTLERLMIDRAMGALEPDAEALLAAYLQSDPRAAEEGRHLLATVELARAAVGPAGAPAPPCGLRDIEAAGRARAWRATARWAASIAASLAVGLTVGLWASGRASRPGSGGGVVVAPPNSVDKSIQPSPRPDLAPWPAQGDFWSVRAFAGQSARAEPTRAPRQVRWSSLKREPTLGAEL